MLPLSNKVTYVSTGIKTHYVLAFVSLNFALLNTGVRTSLEKPCIMQAAAVNSFARALNPQERTLYSAIHGETVSLYYNSSVLLDTQDASSWDQNLHTDKMIKNKWKDW